MSVNELPDIQDPTINDWYTITDIHTTVIVVCTDDSVFAIDDGLDTVLGTVCSNKQIGERFYQLGLEFSGVGAEAFGKARPGQFAELFIVPIDPSSGSDGIGRPAVDGITR